MTPIRKVSASKYAPRAAKVILRIKGSNTPGILYQGQRILKPCEGCGTSSSSNQKSKINNPQSSIHPPSSRLTSRPGG